MPFKAALLSKDITWSRSSRNPFSHSTNDQNKQYAAISNLLFFNELILSELPQFRAVSHVTY